MTNLELLYTTEEDFKLIKKLGLTEILDIVAEHLAECFNRKDVTKLIHCMLEDLKRRADKEILAYITRL